MIEPVRGRAGTFDLSCAACGVIERFAGGYARFLRKAKAAGWMIGTPRAALTCLCPPCVTDARLPAVSGEPAALNL